MSSIFDYLDWRGDIPLYFAGFNELDSLILARLSYIPFDGIVSEDFLSKITVAEAAARFFDTNEAIKRADKNADLILLKKTAESRRFSDLTLCGYINEWDEDAEKQFSAVTVDLPGSVSYISYRGTDSSIVGWKEDFNMSFKCPVPSQESAVSYMNKAASVLTTDLIAGGHSKGGNLAVFAASFCRGDFKGRISSVYNFDGPGFDSKVIEQDGYKDICSRVLTFVPQSSIIGMLLEHEEPYTIIKSRGKNGLIQHNIYSWLVSPKGFTRLDNVDSKSTFIDHTLKEWVRKMTPQEREVFVDTSYNMICKTGAHTVNDLNGIGLKKVMVLLSSLKGMDDESKDVIFGAVELLLESAKISFKKVFL